MIVKRFLSFILLFIISLTVTGCLQVNTGRNKKVILPDGGFFISNDKGTTWKQRTAILTTTATAKNFSLDGVSTITVDPSDSKTIYFGTARNGMLYTYDQGVSWTLSKNLGSGPSKINSIAVDPKNSCTVYASLGHKIFKTKNCNRSWETIFTENSSKIEVTTVGVDHFNSNNIYATLSRGDVIKSVDGGKSWQTVYRFEGKIKKFYIDVNDSRRMYIVEEGKDKGFYRSTDSAKSWQKIDSIFDKFKIGKEVVDFQVFKNKPELMFVATKQGIIKSTDKGATWEQLMLLPPKKNASIVSIAINSENTKEVYYITGSTFYKSVDGGVNWIPRSLPSTKSAGLLLLDQTDNNTLYLGFNEQ